MPTATLPQFFPSIRENEGYSRKIAKADLIRRLAQAQNYLWANIRRTYANFAYEGNGNKLDGLTLDGEPWMEDLPGGEPGSKKGLCVCAFVVPPNWGPSQRLKLWFGWTLANGSGNSTGRLWAGVYKLDGTFLGPYEMLDEKSASAYHQTSAELLTPSNETVQVRVFIDATDMTWGMVGPLAVGDTAELHYVSCRYENGDTTEAPDQQAWQPYAHFPVADHPLSSAMLRAIIRNTNGLWAMRNPEVCHAWLGNPGFNDSTFTEVGRYIFYLPPGVTAIAGRLHVYCTDGGAGNEVRVLIDGVVAETFIALAAGPQDLTLTLANFDGLADDSEHLISIEARSTAAGTDWGTMVWGVQIWEEDVTLSLPGGTSVPAAYEPLDEDRLRGDDEIVSDLNGTVRSGLKHLFENDTWLARHRLRGLVGDWRHRVLKRFDFEGATDVQPHTDWTRGNSEVDFQLGKPRNITIMGANQVTDGLGNSSGQEDRDGLAKYEEGVSEQAPAASELYSNPLNVHWYMLHGSRLARIHAVVPTGQQGHIDDADGAWVMHARANRANVFQPAAWGATGSYGPLPEDAFFRDRAYLLVTHGDQRIFIKSPGDDTKPNWFGPLRGDHDPAVTAFNIQGRCPQASSNHANVEEGKLFEVELRSLLMLDEPLQQTSLTALL